MGKKRTVKKTGGGFDSELKARSLAKVIKKKAEIAAGEIDRVLREITFSGCGFVKKPANPPSVVLETAADKEVKADSDADPIILDYDELEDDINVTSDNTETSSSEQSELQYNDTVGICVSYKKEVYDSTFKDELSKIVHTDWCALYERGCTSFSRDTTDPKCLRNLIWGAAVSCVEDYMEKRANDDRRAELLKNLEQKLV